MLKYLFILSLLLFNFKALCQDLNTHDTLSAIELNDIHSGYAWYGFNPYSCNCIGSPSYDRCRIYGKNIYELMEQADSVNAGKDSLILFSDIQLRDTTKIIKHLETFFYSVDNIHKALHDYYKFEELQKLMRLHFVSGVIYFGGWDFSNAAALSVIGSARLLRAYFDRCGPGSVIVFENIRYKKENGSLSEPLNKTIKL